MKVILIGLGQRGHKFLEAIYQTNQVELAAVCDFNKNLAEKIGKEKKVPFFCSVQELLSEIEKPNLAIVVVPHDQYLPIITELAQHQIHILKEKPLARNLDEAKKMLELAKLNNINIMVGLQRRFDIIYQSFKGFLNQLGKIYHIEGQYNLAVNRLDAGWRASLTQSGGGALLDMGYHFLDLLIWYFGAPSSLHLKKTSKNRYNQKYEVEDTAVLLFDYQQKFTGDEKTIGSFTISRLGYKNQEKIKIKGTDGCLILQRDLLRRYDSQGRLVGSLVHGKDIFSNSLVNMIDHFVRFLQGQEKYLNSNILEHLIHMEVIDKAYQTDTTHHFSTAKDYQWPLITSATEKAVLDQLRSGNISIYDRSGIFKVFEQRFADYHQRKYGLVTNSGTSAIFSMYEGLGLGPHDEVIAPVYTFFATVSPLLYLGAKPVFCDCRSDGNIDPAMIEKKITAKTKAVIVTHMWGIPCDMDKILAICKKYNLKLLEDCSHAHGARYKNKLVGTFGDAAIWSLQGQKIITGGEGGILLTDDQEIYVRAQLQGQYNKRCLQEIPKSHPLFKFAVTGFGLKLRAHPLSIALANEQFDHLDQWLEKKRQYANYIAKELSSIAFLHMPEYQDRNPSWYAFVFYYDESKANCSIEDFIIRLHKLGLHEIERPKSTQPLHKLALFHHPIEAMPRIYSNNFEIDKKFPQAEKIYQTAIKIPVWATQEDEVIVKKYVNGIKKVCHEIESYGHHMMKAKL